MSLGPLNFEIGGAFFNTAQALQSLIAGYSEDDVHNQALIAAGYLGVYIPVAPKRINESVDALGGQTSVNVENVKASIGIYSGGLCRIIRQATPLIQFFALCASFKTVFLDDECGNLIFEMIDQSGVLEKCPCSAEQLTRLVSQVAGQADSIAPVNKMHEVALAVDDWQPKGDTFLRMELNALAELLLKLFENMRDETVDSIVIAGHLGSIWLGSSLLWLFGDESWLLIDDQVIQGDPKAKLCIEIEPREKIPWNMQALKLSENPIKYVFERAHDEVDTLHQIPLKSLKSFMNHYYWETIEDSELRKKAMKVCGEVAQTLIDAIAECGRIYLGCKGCTDIEHCNTAPLRNIAQSSWLTEVQQAIVMYGWDDPHDPRSNPELLDTILNSVQKWRQREEYFHVGPVDGVANMKEACKDFIQRKFPSQSVEIDYILDAAFYIAADAAVTCSTMFLDGRRYIKPLDADTLGHAEQTVLALLSSGLDASEYRERAFKQLLPGLNRDWHNGNLVIARDGYVAGMNILWTESVLQSDALSIRMQRGQIRMGSITYYCIRESAFTSPALCTEDQCVPAFDAVRGLIMPEMGPKHKIQDRAYSFQTTASVHGSCIEIKHYMMYEESSSKTPEKRKASWIDAISVLATAAHADIESFLTAPLAESLMVRLTRDLVAKDACWSDAFYQLPNRSEIRSLMRTGPNPKVKIFGAGVCNERRNLCCYIVIRHRAPLLRCIAKAEGGAPKKLGSWAVVDC